MTEVRIWSSMRTFFYKIKKLTLCLCALYIEHTIGYACFVYLMLASPPPNRQFPRPRGRWTPQKVDLGTLSLVNACLPWSYSPFSSPLRGETCTNSRQRRALSFNPTAGKYESRELGRRPMSRKCRSQVFETGFFERFTRKSIRFFMFFSV